MDSLAGLLGVRPLRKGLTPLFPCRRRRWPARKITPCFENGKSDSIPKFEPVGIGSGTTGLHIVRSSSIKITYCYYSQEPLTLSKLGIPKMTGNLLASEARAQHRIFRTFAFPPSSLPPRRATPHRGKSWRQLMTVCDRLEASLFQVETAAHIS